MSYIMVDNYGIHLDESTGVTWLVQRKLNLNPVGLPSEACPFKVKGSPSCGHNFDFEDIECPTEFLIEIEQIQDYDIFKYVSPTPYNIKNKVVHFRSRSLLDVAAIHYLQCMHSPKNIAHSNRKTTSLIKLKAALNTSTLSKYSITNILEDQMPEVNSFIEVAVSSHGRLILIGEKLPKYGIEKLVHFAEIPTGLSEFIVDLAKYNCFKQYGNLLMKNYLTESYNG